jgi:hypothetical protein
LWEVECGRYVRLTATPPSVNRLLNNEGSSKSRKLNEPPQPDTEIALIFYV